MEIRSRKTWCERCQAPELWPEAAATAELFLQALPAFRIAGGFASLAAEGFDRSEVLALMHLRGIRPAHRAELWEHLVALEHEYTSIRNRQREAEKAGKAGHAVKP